MKVHPMGEKINSDEKAELIKKYLVADEGELWKETLEIARNLIFLSKDGEIHIKKNISALSIKEVILLYTVGKKFAFEAKLAKDESVSLEEISENLKIDKKIAAARTSELKNEGKIKSIGRGIYSLVVYDIKTTLEDIRKKYDK